MLSGPRDVLAGEACSSKDMKSIGRVTHFPGFDKNRTRSSRRMEGGEGLKKSMKSLDLEQPS